MSNDEKVFRQGPLKGKKITYASSGRIEGLAQLAQELMAEVFDLEPGEYVISDESEVRDFTEFGSWDASATWKRIEEVFGVVSEDVSSGRLVDVLAAIAQRRNPQ